MPIPCTRASRWPRLFANSAAAIFIAASGTTNIVYGFGKGDSLATSLVWAAGAVAIVLALSWPALIRSVDAKRWSAAAISLVALMLSGAYSVTAALGSAAGGRANAAAIEVATADARARAFAIRRGRGAVSPHCVWREHRSVRSARYSLGLGVTVRGRSRGVLKQSSIAR